jgi:D-galactarolactone isomerase
MMQRVGLERVVAVQSILYGFDNRCMLDGMALLGTCARGVVTIAPDTPETELRRLHDHGVRGARAYMLPGGSLTWDHLPVIAHRIAPLGWHLQVQLDGREFTERAPQLATLPCPVVIDHNGKFLEPVPVEHPAFVALLRLLDIGRFWIKVSAPYETSRIGPPGYDDVALLAHQLIRHAPQRMLWASNWPHPGRSDKPDERMLLQLLYHWSPSAAMAASILADNPAALYGFDGARMAAAVSAADARGGNAKHAGDSRPQ